MIAPVTVTVAAIATATAFVIAIAIVIARQQVVAGPIGVTVLSSRRRIIAEVSAGGARELEDQNGSISLGRARRATRSDRGQIRWALCIGRILFLMPFDSI